MSYYLQDYIDLQLKTFEELPFNVVDAGVLTQISMVRGMGLIPGLQERASFAPEGTVLLNAENHNDKPIHFRDMLCAEYFDDMFTGGEKVDLRNALFGLSASPRFRELVLRDYLSLFDIDTEMQFSATTYVHNDDFAVICFRGTDATITGWKEDFNMMFMMPVPAQAQALRYVQSVAGDLPEKLYICGHSKGGNLAEYTALKLEKSILDRVEKVYLFDSPGFKDGTFTEQDYAPIINKMYKLVPQDSVVGLLMDSPVPLHIVRSNAEGFNEHSVFTWEVKDEDQSRNRPPATTTRAKIIHLDIPQADGTVKGKDVKVEVHGQLSDKDTNGDSRKDLPDPNPDRIANTIDEKIEAKPETKVTIPEIPIGTDFVYLPEISQTAALIAKSLNDWIAPYSDKKREEVVDAAFNLIKGSGSQNFYQVFANGAPGIAAYLNAASKDHKQEVDTVISAGRDLLNAAAAAFMNKMPEPLEGLVKRIQANQRAEAEQQAKQEKKPSDSETKS